MSKNINDIESHAQRSFEADSPRPSFRERRIAELLSERQNTLPVWIRAPKSGVEYYTGLSRAKLYEWKAKGYIRSVSIREPGQIKGTRLFHLASIFAAIEKCEADAMECRTEANL